MVAMLAKEYRVSVVACVETYKFSDKVVLDAVALNELGDPDLILSGHGQSDLLRDIKGVTPMSLMYDLTPPALITAVCTEVSILRLISTPANSADWFYPSELGTDRIGKGKRGGMIACPPGEETNQCRLSSIPLWCCHLMSVCSVYYT